MLNPLKSLELSSEELKEIAILLAKKEILNVIKDELLSSVTSLKPAKKGKKPKTTFSKERIEKMRKEFNELRHKFSKSKINEIRRNFMNL